MLITATYLYKNRTRYLYMKEKRTSKILHMHIFKNGDQTQCPRCIYAFLALSYDLQAILVTEATEIIDNRSKLYGYRWDFTKMNPCEFSIYT